MSGHVFVDESKRDGLLLVAGVILPDSLADARRAVRGLHLPGQHYIHMVSEGDGRKRTILRSIAELNVSIRLYVAPRKRGRSLVEARQQCLRVLVQDMVDHGHDNLLMDRDESLTALDRRVVRDALRQHGGLDGATMLYDHSKTQSEPLLLLPDAVAWAWPQRRWRGLCPPITSVTEL